MRERLARHPVPRHGFGVTLIGGQEIGNPCSIFVVPANPLENIGGENASYQAIAVANELVEGLFGILYGHRRRSCQLQLVGNVRYQSGIVHKEADLQSIPSANGENYIAHLTGKIIDHHPEPVAQRLAHDQP